MKLSGKWKFQGSYINLPCVLHTDNNLNRLDNKKLNNQTENISLNPNPDSHAKALGLINK